MRKRLIYGSLSILLAISVSQSVGGGVGPDSQRSTGQDRIRALAAGISEERNLGVRDGQVLNRPHLVVLPLLAAQVPPGHVSPFVDGHPAPHADCLQRVDRSEEHTSEL